WARARCICDAMRQVRSSLQRPTMIRRSFDPSILQILRFFDPSIPMATLNVNFANVSSHARHSGFDRAWDRQSPNAAAVRDASGDFPSD
ncbi:MAG: hypothetical protein ACREMA_04000, partial [Longimicrobiales bacterium]